MSGNGFIPPLNRKMTADVPTLFVDNEERSAVPEYAEEIESEDDVCIFGKEISLSKFLLLGSGVFFMLGLVGLLCFSRKKHHHKDTRGSSSSSWSGRDYGRDASWLVNLQYTTTPELSESESGKNSVPLPLVYEDMGCICKNAEIFIERCMTSSIKRTYSEPVKNVIGSRTRCRDYLAEKPYIINKTPDLKRNNESPFKAFLANLVQGFNKEYKEKKTKKGKLKNQRSSGKSKKGAKPSVESTDSVTITDILLSPRYQFKKYKTKSSTNKKGQTVKHNKLGKNSKPKITTKHLKEVVKTEKNNCSTEGNNTSADLCENSETTPLVPLNPQRYGKNHTGEKESLEMTLTKYSTQLKRENTEEVINMFTEQLRYPQGEQIIRIFDTLSKHQVDGTQDVVAGTCDKMWPMDDAVVMDSEQTVRQDTRSEKNFVSEKINDAGTISVEPGQSSGRTNKISAFELLVKKIFFLAAANNVKYLTQSESRKREDSEEAEINEGIPSEMAEKYKSLELNLACLTKEMKIFANEFLENNK